MSKYKEFFAHATRLGKKHDLTWKQDMVSYFTHGRTTSLKEMHDSEYLRMVKYLRQQTDLSVSTQELRKMRMNEMRKKIFSLCRTMGYISGYSQADKKINQHIVYSIVERYGYLKPKPLGAYTWDELPKLVSQFEKMRKNNDEAAANKLVKALKQELNLL